MIEDFEWNNIISIVIIGGLLFFCLYYGVKMSTIQSLEITIIVIIGGLLFFCLYYGVKMSTIQSLEITIKEKWIKGITEGQIYLIGTENEVFANEDELMVFKFNSSDYWNNIEEGKKYKVEVIGWRIPFLSMYRNIIKLEPC
jgi:hypothetical protein